MAQNLHPTRRVLSADQVLLFIKKDVSLVAVAVGANAEEQHEIKN